MNALAHLTGDEAMQAIRFAERVERMKADSSTVLRRLWLAAADASEAVSDGYRSGQSDRVMDRLEDTAFDAEQALREHLLTEFGLTSADLKRSVL